MRIVFMGTPDIAAACLEKLLTEHMNVVAVYTKPDTPQNRGMKLTQSPVKRVALAHEIPVYQPAGFREAAAVEELRALKPDVIAVVDFASGGAGYSSQGLHQHPRQPAARPAGLRPCAVGGAPGTGRDGGHSDVYGSGDGCRGHDRHPKDPR